MGERCSWFCVTFFQQGLRVIKHNKVRLAVFKIGEIFGAEVLGEKTGCIVCLPQLREGCG